MSYISGNSTRHASQLKRTRTGLLIYKYNEPPTTLEEQINRIRERGMTVSQPDEAMAFLRRVGYYRFSGYALHYL